MDVGISEHEVGREKLDGVLSEDLVADHLGHLIVDETVSLLIASLDDQTLSCLDRFIDIHFLCLILIYLSHLPRSPFSVSCERHHPQHSQSHLPFLDS